MRWFGWFRRAPQEETEDAPPRRWGWLSGRRVLMNTPYIFPKDKVEGDRLDLQHHLLRLAAGGNYRAPIRHPRDILDVACGTGIWGREMAQQFQRARVIGFDIDRTPLERSLELLGPGGQFPTNFRFLTADALKPFPFEDGEFDFVHARLLSPFAPIVQWPQVVAEMVRVTRPGGYIELVDCDFPESESQALHTLTNAMAKLMALRSQHPGAGPYLADYLRQAGLQHVQQRQVVLGAGPQSKRQQRLIAADLMAVHTNLQPIIVKTGIMTEAEYSATLARERVELARASVTWPFVFAFSLKL